MSWRERRRRISSAQKGSTYMCEANWKGKKRRDANESAGRREFAHKMIRENEEKEMLYRDNRGTGWEDGKKYIEGIYPFGRNNYIERDLEGIACVCVCSSYVER